MAKAVDIPYGYECPYREACPHLQGMSAEWLWLRHQEDLWEQHAQRQRIDELVAQLQERDRRIAQLEEAWTQTQAQLHALHRQQFKANRGSDNSSEQEGPSAEGGPKEKKKKRGAPSGHPGWSRRVPDHIDRRVSVPAPQRCPHCQRKDLQPCPERHQHVQEDIVLSPQTYVVCFDHQQAWCPHCQRTVLQAASGELLGAHIGPVAKSTASLLRQKYSLSYRSVQGILSDLFGLPLVPASAWNFDRTAAAKAQGLYEDLHQKIQASAYLHGDETSWRVDGISYWLWYAGHEDLAYFHIDRHRSGEVARAVIGENFPGLLNTDDYAAYNAVKAGGRQSCLAHPLRLAREALAALEANPAVDRASENFLREIKEFLRAACELGQQLQQKPVREARADALQAEQWVRRDKLCRRTLAWEPAEGLRQRLIKQRENLFTFIHHPEVQPTNNQAEQSLRRSVIMRKVTFGNRSEKGARTQAVLCSLITTAERQGRDARAALERLWTEPLAVAQRAFYRQVKSPPCKAKRKVQPCAQNPVCRRRRARTGRDPPAPLR